MMWNRFSGGHFVVLSSGVLGGLLAGLLLANRGPYTRLQPDGYGRFGYGPSPDIFRGDEVGLAVVCGSVCAALTAMALRVFVRRSGHAKLIYHVSTATVVAIGLTGVPLAALYLVEGLQVAGDQKHGALMLLSLLALLGVLVNMVIAPIVGLATLASARCPVSGQRNHWRGRSRTRVAGGRRGLAGAGLDPGRDRLVADRKLPRPSAVAAAKSGHRAFRVGLRAGVPDWNGVNRSGGEGLPTSWHLHGDPDRRNSSCRCRDRRAGGIGVGRG